MKRITHEPVPSSIEAMTERRSHERLPSSIEAVLVESHTQARKTCRATDVGVGGCYVSTEYPFPKGTRVAIHFTDGERTFNCHAIVIHSTLGEGMGLAFIETSPGQGTGLTAWLSDLKENPEVTIARMERRTHLRLAVSMAVEIFGPLSGMHLNCRVTNLSLEGCYVEIETPFQENMRVVVRLIREGLSFESPAIVRGAVSGKGMGLEFSDTAPDQEATLLDWLRELSKQDHEADTVSSLLV